MTEIPPKLRDLVECQYFECSGITDQTKYQYRYSVKQLAIALGYNPTLKDLRECCLDWLENRLVISGHANKSTSECVRRLRTLLAWFAIRRMEARELCH